MVYLLIGFGLLLATVLPDLVRERAVSAPMIVLGVGVVAGLLVPGQDPISPVLDAEATSYLAEACVIISLMGVGLAIGRPFSWRTWSPTWRLLAVAMPLCIVGVAFLGWWGLGLSVPAALLLGAVLAPTDPVLASDVQVPGPAGHDEDEDEQDEPRFALTSEAGLNDALAFPFVYLALMLMTQGPLEDWWAGWVLWTLVGKIVVGGVLGWVAGVALGRVAFRSSVRSLRVAEGGNPLLALAATFAVYGLTELVGGYGFLAVFVAAVALRSVERGHGYHRDLHELVERLETILTLVILLLLGAALTSGLLQALEWRSVLLGVILVAVLRPLAGWVSLLGESRLDRTERWAVSLLGVRGIGSVYYLSFALSEEGVAEDLELWGVVAFTIVLSVIVHGVLATPVMRRLDRRRSGSSVATGS